MEDVQSCAEGDLGRRGKPKCRGIKIGEGLLRAVDDLVVEEFERGKIMWRLNCLVYAGAVVVANRLQRPSKTPRMQQVNPQKQADVARLHRTIGWLESEISRVKQGTKATARQRTNIRRLKLERCPLRELEASLETQKARLRVRVTQLRRLRANARSKAINAAYRRQGKKCLSSRSSRPEGVQSPSPEDIRSYWSSVIGVEGHFDLSNRAIR